MNDNNTEATEGSESAVERVVMRCFTCKHWKGDKERAVKMYEENPLSMDLHKGWPDSGDCIISYEWLYTVLDGNAAAYSTVDANFGCVYWGA